MRASGKNKKYSNINVDHEPLERPRKAASAFPILRVLVNWKFYEVKYLKQRAIGKLKKTRIVKSGLKYLIYLWGLPNWAIILPEQLP